ncbi:MAG: DUF4340 domain-containing protein [Gammaproteobacteria bacterium]|nr:DUF4340 domain-containing protein [Gammaproteobacteria bacterium]
MNYPLEQPQDPGNAITSLQPSEVDRIKIETADVIIELKKTKGSWRIVSPIDWFANNIASERLATMATLEAQSKLPRSDIDLSTLGLTFPKAILTLNQQSIIFGDTNRIGNRRYLLVEPEVYLVDDIHFPFISQGLNGLLDNRLLPSSVALQSLQIKDWLISKEQNQWVSSKPQHEAPELERLITEWQTTQASSIKAYDSSLTPLHKITARTQDHVIYEYFLLSIQPEIVIARPDLNLQYHFPEHQYYDLLSLDNPDG